MSDEPSSHLAKNLRALREARDLTQQQMAKLAGIPRATWSHLESDAANPTLQVLVKVAAALQVRVEELLAPPRSAALHVRAKDLPTRRRGDVVVRRLLPEALPGFEIERMLLPPQSHMVGVPHTAGTREYLTLERGEIELRVAGEVYVLAPGDVVTFRGDQRHGYRNPGKQEAVAYSVIAFAPTGS